MRGTASTGRTDRRGVGPARCATGAPPHAKSTRVSEATDDEGGPQCQCRAVRGHSRRRDGRRCLHVSVVLHPPLERPLLRCRVSSSFSSSSSRPYPSVGGDHRPSSSSRPSSHSRHSQSRNEGYGEDPTTAAAPSPTRLPSLTTFTAGRAGQGGRCRQSPPPPPTRKWTPPRPGNSGGGGSGGGRRNIRTAC